MPLLTWNVGGSDKNWVNNIAVEAFGDTQTKIILCKRTGQLSLILRISHGL